MEPRPFLWNVSAEWPQDWSVHAKRPPVKADEVCKARAQPVKDIFVGDTMFSARPFTLGDSLI